MASQPPRPRSVLAIDVGRRRIGLAGCDALGISITPLKPLQRGAFARDLAVLQPLAASRRITALVVGLPLDSAGQPTEQARHCRRYGQALARALGLPIAWVNEHSSSWAAGEQHGLHGDRSGALDSAVAALLLEQWLREGPEPMPIGPQAIEAGQDAGAASS